MTRLTRQDRRALFDLRISRGYFPNSPPSSADLMAGHSYLFIRDLPLGIMPMGRGLDKRDWSVSLEQIATPEETEWITTLLEVSDFGGRDLTSAVKAFVEEIARELAYSGETFYEIVKEASGDPPLAHLLSLPFGQIRRRGDVVVQHVAPADRGPGEPSEITIPAEQMLCMALPADLGTPEEHREFLAELVKLSSSMPKFALESQQLGKDSGYDFMAHQRAQEIAIEHAMAKWGTVPSVRHLKGTTDYFFIVRTLQFSRSKL
jgi:hypothetical protein